MKIDLLKHTDVGSVDNSKSAYRMYSDSDIDKPLLQFKDKNELTKNTKNGYKQQETSDTQQLTEDAVWLAELWEGIQNGEAWAIEEARKLEVADDPDADDKSQNAQLLRSNNELARAIINSLKNDKTEEAANI